MPQLIIKDRSDLSVSIGVKLRNQLVEACKEEERNLSDVTKEALKRWLATRERRKLREAKNNEA